jgi:transposase-like protein
MSNNIWANQQLKELQQALIDINVADEFAQRSKNILPDAIEDRQGFIIRHLNEFNIANQNNLVLYTKADAASYLESLKAQRKETEQRISILRSWCYRRY